MVYGGTIRPGSCEGQPQLDIISAFQSYGKFIQDGKTPEAEKFRYATVRHACPGPGACGGVRVHYKISCLHIDNLVDVHRKYNGERYRSVGNDPSWFIVVPCPVTRKNRGVPKCRRCHPKSC